MSLWNFRFWNFLETRCKPRWGFILFYIYLYSLCRIASVWKSGGCSILYTQLFIQNRSTDIAQWAKWIQPKSCQLLTFLIISWRRRRLSAESSKKSDGNLMSLHCTTVWCVTVWRCVVCDGVWCVTVTLTRACQLSYWRRIAEVEGWACTQSTSPLFIKSHAAQQNWPIKRYFQLPMTWCIGLAMWDVPYITWLCLTGRSF